ncbi:MAG: type I-C CRISPR-associated protein Cas8c/Csd1 [[Eubacterium] siraeum]
MTKKKNRPTNAKRLFEAFSNHPRETWKVLCLSLRPYLNRMNIGKRANFERMINQITAMFPLDTYNDNSPLSSEFLHAYSCQMNDLFKNEVEQ